MQLGGLERGQVGEELLLAPRELLSQVVQVRGRKLEALKEGKALRQSGKYGEFPLEWVLSDEKVKGSIFFSISSLCVECMYTIVNCNCNISTFQ